MKSPEEIEKMFDELMDAYQKGNLNGICTAIKECDKIKYYLFTIEIVSKFKTS